MQYRNEVITMKMKPEYLIQDIENTQYMVSIGNGVTNRIIRNNKTAAFIVNQLQEDTTVEKIVDAMCAKYDAPREVIVADVEEILQLLRKVNALEE